LWTEKGPGKFVMGVLEIPGFFSVNKRVGTLSLLCCSQKHWAMKWHWVTSLF